MAYEEETHQEQDEEQIQLQKQRENDQFQRELDEIITRLENEQFQKELDEIIARLEHKSQEYEEDISSHESVSEGKSEQEDIREKFSTTKYDHHEEETTEEEQTQNQEFTEIEDSLQDSIKSQEIDQNLLQEEEEFSPYQSATEEKSDKQNSHEQTTDAFEELTYKHEEIAEEQQIQSQDLTKTKESGRDQEVEQRTANLDIKNTESLIHGDREATRNQNPIENNKQDQQDLCTASEKSHQINQNKIKETESKIEKENYSKQLEETITEQDVERKRQSIIEIGNEAINTGKHSDLRKLARKWNDYISKGGRPTTEMWKTYNTIQEVHDKPIVLYKEDDGNNNYRMSICGKLFSQLDSGNISARQINKIFEYWQIQNGTKEGIKPFFEVTIRNPATGEIGTFWVPNTKEKAWNPYKAKNREFFNIRSSSWAKITEFLATKIHLNEKDVRLYNEIERSLRKKYPRLGVQTVKGSFSTLGNQKALFKKVFRLNYQKDVIDEAIKLTFWKYAGTYTYNHKNTAASRKEITQMRINFSSFGNSVQKSKITQRIYRLSADGSVSRQNWTDDLESSIKSSDPNFIIYENTNGEINGISAPHLVKKIKDLLFFKDKSSVKSAGRMFNNLIALTGYEPPLNLGTYYWKRLFSKNTDLHQFGIPEPYQTTFIHRETSGPVGKARWMIDFQNEFLMPLTDWLKASGLKDFSKQITIQNPNTEMKYKKRFNNLSAYLKFQAGLGEWKDKRWQGVYNKIYVLKYDLEHILAITKYVSASVQLPGRDNRTGKNKEKLLEFFQTTNEVEIINIVPKSKNFKFIATLSSRKQALTNFYKNLIKNSSTGSRIVQAHLTSVLESCKPLAIDPWTIQKAVNHKYLIKAPESLAELLTEEGDGPINSFCSGLFMDLNFREFCNTVHNINFNMKFLQYPNNERDYIITQSMKSRKMADTYGESFTTASIPDVVTSYQKNSGSTEMLFIKVVCNDIVHRLEEDIGEILKTNNDSDDPFRVFTACIFLDSDLNSLPMNSVKYKELMLLLQKYNADGIINLEIPDLNSTELKRFGEIWASCKNEYITNKKYEDTRIEFLKDPASSKDRLVDNIMDKINSFQKLNPIDRKTVENGFEIIDFEAVTRTEFILNTLMNYLSRILY